jgi:predicted RNase H-like nuclease (RuvC/YqgF family)
METIEHLNSSYFLAQQELQQSQNRNQELQQQLLNRDRQAQQLETRCSQLEKQKAVHDSELSKLVH